MKQCQFIFLCVLVALCLAEPPVEEKQALQDVYTALNGLAWRRQLSWNSEESICIWEGVACDVHRETVTELKLSSNSVSGELPKALTRLPNLQILNLDDNPLLSGDLGILSELTDLRVLNISKTKFRQIPDSWQSLTNLEYLYFRQLPLDPGPFPNGLRNCKKLVELDCGGNPFTGQLPEWLGYFRLTTLRLDHTNFGGMIPDGFYNFNSIMSELDLSEIPLTPAPIPSWIGDFTRLITLKLSNSQRTGKVPDGLWQLFDYHLDNLYLDRNHLTGEIPSGYFDTKRLNVLDLSDNQFGGTCPLISNYYFKTYCSLRNIPWKCPLSSFCEDTCGATCSYF